MPAIQQLKDSHGRLPLHTVSVNGTFQPGYVSAKVPTQLVATRAQWGTNMHSPINSKSPNRKRNGPLASRGQLGSI